MQSRLMEPHSATEHLQVIRTLMERSAIYRRALAPMTLLVGGVGSVAAIVGGWYDIQDPVGFVAYWLLVGIVTLAAALVLVRRQALKDAEPFWSPPARRVVRALFPGLFAGFAAGVAALVALRPGGGFERARLISQLVLPAAWLMLYGCASHAAGFFMVRGIRWFGWGFVLCGCGLLLGLSIPAATLPSGHLLMGVTFGGLHLAYGTYLYVTEKQTNAA